MYSTLILSTNYVTKRQSLKLLGEILLDRANYNIMTKYIGSEANLKMMMNFLRDRSRNIQFEAFHVFKVSPNAFQADGRCLWQIQINHPRLQVSFGGTRINCSCSCENFITTKMVGLSQ
jgi:hypothetical protein